MPGLATRQPLRPQQATPDYYPWRGFRAVFFRELRRAALRGEPSRGAHKKRKLLSKQKLDNPQAPLSSGELGGRAAWPKMARARPRTHNVCRERDPPPPVLVCQAAQWRLLC